MSRSQRAYVQDILDAMEKAERYTEGVRFDEFAADEEKQDAVEWNFAVMGEAAKKLSNELRRKNDDLLWSDIARMRDRIVHGYFSVDLEILWETVNERLPQAKARLREILREMES